MHYYILFLEWLRTKNTLQVSDTRRKALADVIMMRIILIAIKLRYTAVVHWNDGMLK